MTTTTSEPIEMDPVPESAPKGKRKGKDSGDVAAIKFDIPHQSLVEAMAAVGRGAPTKSTLPVLSNVLVEASSGKLTLSATNLDLRVTRAVDATVWTEGATTLPARLLADYVAQLDKDQSVSFEMNPKTWKMRLRSGRYEANIAVISAEDFPPAPTVNGTTFTLPAAKLKDAISRVAFCSAPDDTRPALAGVLLSATDDNRLALVAADGFRLGTFKIDVVLNGAKVETLVPAATLRAVERLLPGDGEQSVNVTIGEKSNHVRIATDDGLEVLGRLIDGKFPDYQRIIPKDYTTAIVGKTDDLLRAVKAAMVFARDNSNIVRFTAHQNGLTIKGLSAEMGDDTVEIDGQVAGPGLDIAFNSRLVSNVLDNLGTDQVRLELTTTSAPGVFMPEPWSGDQLYLVMPMHVAG